MAGYVVESSSEYQVVQGTREKIGLPTHEHSHREGFSLPSGLAKVHRPVVSFVLEKTEGARLKITVNGHQIYDMVLSDGDDRCVQEVFNDDYLREGQNEMVFEATAGTVHYRGVVLLYQRDHPVTGGFQWPWLWVRKAFRSAGSIPSKSGRRDTQA